MCTACHSCNKLETQNNLFKESSLTEQLDSSFSVCLLQVYASASGEDFNRDNAGYAASKAGNIYPSPFYMQGYLKYFGLLP